MHALIRLFDRVVPALLMAAGVTLLAAGLLSWTEPVLGEPPTRPNATQGTVAERPDLPSEPSPSEPSPAASPSVPTAVPSPSTPPDASPGGSPEPTPGSSGGVPPTSFPSADAGPSSPTVTREPASGAAATRVVVPSERIDLPVISRQERVPGQGPDLYPPCDVAIFHDAFRQPAQEGTTYLYAHARSGMFLPLLEASEQQDGASLLGALVEVYTADDRLYVYEIFEVKRHAVDFSLALDVPPGERRLVLQTSEGPRGTVPKLQVAARQVSELAATPDEARPRPRPVACYS